MKTLISILLLFCSFVSYSQTSFSDTLYYSQELIGKSLILRTDLSFQYYVRACMFLEEGKGTYTIQNNMLTLHFKEDVPRVPSTHSVVDLNCDSLRKLNVIPDSTKKICLFFNVLDKDNKMIEGATVVLQNIGRGTNIKKNINNRINNIEYNLNLKIKVQYPGLNTYKFDLTTNTCKYLEIKLLEESSNTIPDGTVMRFEINNKLSNRETILLSETTNLTLTPIIEKEDE